MLNKLKIKFVAINMCLVGIVLIVVFAAVCVNTYKHGKEEVDRTLAMALSDDLRKIGDPKEIGVPPEGKTTPEASEVPELKSGSEDGEIPQKNADKTKNLYDEPDGFNSKAMNYTAVVVLMDETNKDYELVKTAGINSAMNDAAMEEKTLEKAVSEVRNSASEKGKLSEQGLFYMKRETTWGTKVAFVDSAYFDTTIKESLISALTLFLMGMTVVFFISILLARMAVSPVRKAWEQQKRFIADASHELKTPLTIMLTNNEILLSATVDSIEEQKKWIESNQEEAVHMKNLVDDLLFLAGADEDLEGRRLIKQRLDLSELVTDVSLQFEPVVFEAQLSLVTNIEEKIFFDCDETQMKQFLHILLDNAVKYAGKEGVIWISLERIGRKIRLLVANTGNIIDDEELEHIFDRFYRSDKARSREGGYGLGLSIAKTIAENHGGKMKAQSGDLNAMEIPAKWQLPHGTEGTLMMVNL